MDIYNKVIIYYKYMYKICISIKLDFCKTDGYYNIILTPL